MCYGRLWTSTSLCARHVPPPFGYPRSAIRDQALCVAQVWRQPLSELPLHRDLLYTTRVINIVDSRGKEVRVCYHASLLARSYARGSSINTRGAPLKATATEKRSSNKHAGMLRSLAANASRAIVGI